MEQEKKKKYTYLVNASEMMVINKKDFETKKFIFYGVCECACLAMETESGKVVLYHEYLSDSINDVKKALSNLTKNDTIKSVLIFGGNINNLFHANKNTKDIKLYHGMLYDKVDEKIVKKSGVENESSKTEDIDYDKMCKTYRGAMTSSDIIFQVSFDDHDLNTENEKKIPQSAQNLNTQDVEKKSTQILYTQDIKKTPESVKDYDREIQDAINSEDMICVNYDYCATLYFHPKYENFCGPENLQKLRDIITDLGFDKSKIKEMRTPIESHIEVFLNDQNCDIQMVEDVQYKEMLHIQPQQSPEKTGYIVKKFSLPGADKTQSAKQPQQSPKKTGYNINKPSLHER